MLKYSILKVKENERLFAMYTARGRQIEELETQIDKLRTEHATQVRLEHLMNQVG